MASTRKTHVVAKMNRLDSKPYMDKVRKARELADRALRSHGEPTMTLDELRSRMATELRGASLTEIVLKEREAGW